MILPLGRLVLRLLAAESTDGAPPQPSPRACRASCRGSCLAAGRDVVSATLASDYMLSWPLANADTEGSRSSDAQRSPVQLQHRSRATSRRQHWTIRDSLFSASGCPVAPKFSLVYARRPSFGAEECKGSAQQTWQHHECRCGCRCRRDLLVFEDPVHAICAHNSPCLDAKQAKAWLTGLT